MVQISSVSVQSYTQISRILSETISKPRVNLQHRKYHHTLKQVMPLKDLSMKNHNFPRTVHLKQTLNLKFHFSHMSEDHFYC